jgi:hypothetical protein
LEGSVELGEKRVLGGDLLVGVAEVGRLATFLLIHAFPELLVFFRGDVGRDAILFDDVGHTEFI